MASCCAMDPGARRGDPTSCPACGTRGRPVPPITLKSLLRPGALERLDPRQQYLFCPAADCDVVYFGAAPQPLYTVTDLKVPVFPKDRGDDVPVCYCFHWTRRRLRDDLRTHGRSTAPGAIQALVRREVCGCEVNNPQGSCCLGNVQRVVRELQHELPTPAVPSPMGPGDERYEAGR